MKLLIALVVLAAAQCCLSEPTAAVMGTVIQECQDKEHIPDEDLKSLWEGGYDDGGSNEIMRFTKCLLEQIGIASDGFLKDDFIEKCSENIDPQKCANIHKKCGSDGTADELERGFQIFVCLRKEFI